MVRCRRSVVDIVYRCCFWHLKCSTMHIGSLQISNVYRCYISEYHHQITPPVAYLGFHFGGGVQIFFGKVGVFAWREASCSAWRSHAFVRGVRGHAPPRNFLKMVQFGAFWRIFC